MNSLQERFDNLEGFLGQLVRKFEIKRQIDAEKTKVAKELIGLPYYFNDWSGEVISSTKPTQVNVALINNKTGTEALWTFDAFYALEQVVLNYNFTSWTEYNNHKVKQDKVDLLKMLKNFGWEKSKIEQEMEKFRIQFE
jgi:hypothetical protein